MPSSRERREARGAHLRTADNSEHVLMLTIYNLIVQGCASVAHVVVELRRTFEVGSMWRGGGNNHISLSADWPARRSAPLTDCGKINTT